MLDSKQQKQSYETLSNINFLALQSLQSTIQDTLTLNTYIQTIKQNQTNFIQKIVLHLTNGCNCLYSIIAARMGASKVYCVMNGHGELEKKNIYMMSKIVQENGYQNIIKCMFLKDFNAEVQIIIGQPTGYNMFYDGLLDRMIECRDLYMKDKQNGLIIPNKLRYKCAFIYDEHYIIKKRQFWNEVYGIPMQSMKNWISHQPIVRVVDPLLIVSQAVKFIDFDLMKISYEEIDEIYKKFTIKTPTDCLANGITIWPQIQFKKANGEKLQIKASPWCQTTKFAQITFYGIKEWELKSASFKNIIFYGKKNHMQGITTINIKVDDNQQQIYQFS